MTSKSSIQLLKSSFTGLFLCVATLNIVGGRVSAQSFFENTYLLNISAGINLSEKIGKYSIGGYELADGTPVNFRDWYSSNWNDLSFTLLKEVNNNFGLYWGLSTGEHGQKYQIQPSLKVGFLISNELSRNSRISFSATTILGGYLREETCIADFGEIGGIQTVNCRLAATALPPAETLQFLFNDPPPDQTEITFRIKWTF